MHAPSLGLLLLLTGCISLAAYLDPRVPTPAQRRAQSSSLLDTLMGDSRRLFATHFLLKADAYFHSGYYPGIFDDAKSFDESHISEETTSKEGHPAVEPSETAKDHGQIEHKEEAGFLHEPRDWIDRFSRHFYPSIHTHLDEGGASAGEHKPGESATDTKGEVREMLPWLKLSVELDPNRVEIYVVTAYWLRTRLGKTKEAEQFLREGLRANPGHPALLFELGRIYSEVRQDSQTARNLWELALRKWQETEAPKQEPDKLLLSQIAANLAKLEDTEGHYDRALAYWELVKRVSPHPEEVDKRIAEVKAKPANQPKSQGPTN
jgi:tetratricopeptide (TPR) repeat protein